MVVHRCIQPITNQQHAPYGDLVWQQLHQSSLSNENIIYQASKILLKTRIKISMTGINALKRIYKNDSHWSSSFNFPKIKCVPYVYFSLYQCDKLEYKLQWLEKKYRQKKS